MSKTVKRMLGVALLFYVYPFVYLAAFLIYALKTPDVICYDCFNGIPNPILHLTLWEYACGASLLLAVGLTFAALRLHKEEKFENARY